MVGDPNRTFVKRLRWSGALVAVGLAIQMATLLEAHPFTFLGFLIGGAGLVIAGAFAFLWARLAR
jgi:hypothetical protein